jgi:hypothetical protein
LAGLHVSVSHELLQSGGVNVIAIGNGFTNGAGFWFGFTGQAQPFGNTVRGVFAATILNAVDGSVGLSDDRNSLVVGALNQTLTLSKTQCPGAMAAPSPPP